MAVPTTIAPGPRSRELDGLAEAIESHPIWTELRGPVRDQVAREATSSTPHVDYCGGFAWVRDYVLPINSIANCAVHTTQAGCIQAIADGALTATAIDKGAKGVKAGIGILTKDTGEAAGALTENQIGSTTEDILANATRGNVSKAAQYTKTGGMDQANSDFDLLTRGADVVDQGGGLRAGTLSNGTNVTVRPFSTGKFPTLDIRTPGNLPIKIRY